MKFSIYFYFILKFYIQKINISYKLIIHKKNLEKSNSLILEMYLSQNLFFQWRRLMLLFFISFILKYSFYIFRWLENFSTIFQKFMINKLLKLSIPLIFSIWHSIFSAFICDTFRIRIESLVLHYAICSSSKLTHSSTIVVFSLASLTIVHFAC